MDFSRTYDLELSHQLTLGYRDADSSYFADLITVAPEPETVWTYKPPVQYLQSELQARPLDVMLAVVQAAVRQELDGQLLVLPDHEYQQLQQAPEISPVRVAGDIMTDTDYAVMTDAPQTPQRRSQQTDILRQLITVARMLEGWEVFAGVDLDAETPLEVVLQDILVRSVSQLTQQSTTFGVLLDWDELAVLANVEEDASYQRLDDLISASSLARADAFIAEQTGGVTLSEFPGRIASGESLSDFFIELINQTEAGLEETISAASSITNNATTSTPSELQVALSILQRGASELQTIEQRESNDESVTGDTYGETRNFVIAGMAMELAGAVSVLSAHLPASFIEEAEASLNSHSSDAGEWVQNEYLTAINGYVRELCGTALTDFPIAIADGSSLMNRLNAATVLNDSVGLSPSFTVQSESPIGLPQAL